MIPGKRRRWIAAGREQIKVSFNFQQVAGIEWAKNFYENLSKIGAELTDHICYKP